MVLFGARALQAHIICAIDVVEGGYFLAAEAAPVHGPGSVRSMEFVSSAKSLFLSFTLDGGGWLIVGSDDAELVNLFGVSEAGTDIAPFFRSIWVKQ